IFLFRKASRVSDELDRTQALIEWATGVRPMIVRPPCGVRTPGFFRAAKRLGLSTIQWTVAGFDWKPISREAIAGHVLSKIGPDSIILLHDGDGDGLDNRMPTVEAVKLILDGLKAKGLSIVPLADLLKAGDSEVLFGELNHTV